MCVCFLFKPDMHPKGSPKFNLQKAALGVKKIPSNNQKRRSPKGSKPRAQWNMGLQKSLVDILHEHNNDYHRAQNGWSGDTWNLMMKIFKDRNKRVNFTKSQLQDQEKKLKRQYCMLKEARKQSGVGWCEKSCRIVADDALWDNLLISFPKIGKFKKYDFPLFDTLGDLYDGQIAEGRYNFTSISKTSQIGEEYEDVQSADGNDDDELHILDGGGTTQRGDEWMLLKR
uniref:Uncharacterized protein n=1 Tax=Avena sativa TaxID=4498 RepID=A0ACD5YAZ4_AVESA